MKIAKDQDFFVVKNLNSDLWLINKRNKKVKSYSSISNKKKKCFRGFLKG